MDIITQNAIIGITVLFLSGRKFAYSLEDTIELCPDVENVALNKVAKQSGSTTESSANVAIDGIKNTCSLISRSTSREDNGVWWFVDLGEIHQIYDITICSKPGYWKKQEFAIKIDYEYCASHNQSSNNPFCVTFTCLMVGQYVSVIEQSGTETMTLCEVIIRGHPYFAIKKNIAYGKKATQIGTSNNNGPEMTIDLCKDTCVQIDSTNGGKEPGAVNMGAWWDVDLGGNYKITEVIICNSNNFVESKKLEKFKIKIDEQTYVYYDSAIGKGVCKSFNINVTGQSVSIKKQDGENVHQMTLCEVIVLGHPSIENAALKKHAAQSDNNKKTARNVVDGVKHQCSRVDVPNKTKAYWYVDLGQYFKLMNVTVCNSVDKNDYKYLRNFEVMVDQRQCHYHQDLVDRGECVTVNCVLSGRYITVQKIKDYSEDMHIITLCEVMVMGYPYNLYKAHTNRPTCFTKTCGYCNSENALCMPVEEQAGAEKHQRNFSMPNTYILANDSVLPVYTPYLYLLLAIPLTFLVASLFYSIYGCKMKESKLPIIDDQGKDEIDSRNYDIFISYRTSDDEERLFVVKILFPYLRKMGYHCCLDVKDFLPGHSIADCILKGIAESRGTILVISPAFLRGEWPEFELQVALQQTIRKRKSKHFLIPVIYKPILHCKNNISPTLDYILKSHIYLEWTSESYKGNSEFWKKLKFRLPKLRNTPNNLFHT